MPLSKIFNFLSADTYSSLGVNFFRFPFGFGGRERGEREEQLEILKNINEIINEAENIMRDYSNEHQTPQRERYLNIIQFYYNELYNELKKYKKYKPAEETLERLRAILENNGRNPKK